MDAKQRIATVLREAFESSGKKYGLIALEIGKSESSVSRYATGHTPPSRAVIKRLAQAHYLSESAAEDLINLLATLEDQEGEPAPLQALKDRFRALEARSELLELQLANLRTAFDNHIERHT